MFRPHDIAVRGGYIYWANWSVFIGRANLDGTGVRWITIGSDEEVPTDVAVGPGASRSG